jgi:phage terminase large subunit
MALREAVSGHTRMVCGREIQNSIDDSVKQLLEDKINEFGLTDSFRVTDREISYEPTDSLFVFRGLRNHTVASIKSMEGFNRLWLEEAQTISQKSIDLAFPTFRTKGSQIWCSWNPNDASDPIDRFFRENEGDEDFVCVRANYWDNPWFPDELRSDKDRDKRRDPDKYAHVWCGEYQRASEARVFRNWKTEEFDTPQGTRFYFGADWGFSVDPTALVRCWIKGRTLYIDQEAVQVGCEIDRTPALFDTVPGSREWQITADSARPETISYMQRNGFPRIKHALKGKDSVQDGIEFLKSHDIVVHPRCEYTIRELSRYAYKTDRLTGEVLKDLEDKENHVIDALRYALEGVRRASTVKTEELRI